MSSSVDDAPAPSAAAFELRIGEARGGLRFLRCGGTVTLGASI
jgi:hypothetical protein